MTVDNQNQAFDELCNAITGIEQKFDPFINDERLADRDLVVVVDNVIEENGNENPEDESCKIALQNDRFRQAFPTSDSDIKGEWLFSEDITDLGAELESEIGRLIAERSSEGFEGVALRDNGEVAVTVAGDSKRIVWRIDYFADDSLSDLVSEPSHMLESYRALSVVLSSEE